MAQWICMNGDFVTREEATVSFYDRGFLFGDGVFEGIRAYNGNVFRLREHLVRLFHSANAILLNIPYTIDQIEDMVVETLKKNNLITAYIRIIVSRGVGEGFNLDPFICMNPQTFISAEAFEAFPDRYYETGIEIVTVPTRRNRADVLSPQVKSLNYLNNILVKAEAKLAGVHDGLMLNTEGYVVEGTTQNIFVVSGNRLVTPPCYLGALEGITRNTVMELAIKTGYEVYEKPLTRYDIYSADEVFMTGTAAEIIAVVKVDGRVIANGKPGNKTRQLYHVFKEYVLQDGTSFSL